MNPDLSVFSRIRQPDSHRVFNDTLTSIQNGQKHREFMTNAPMRQEMRDLSLSQAQYADSKTRALDASAKIHAALSMPEPDLNMVGSIIQSSAMDDEDKMESLQMLQQNPAMLREITGQAIQGVRGKHMPKANATYVGRDGDTYQDIYEPDTGRSYTQKVEGAPKRLTFAEKIEMERESDLQVAKDKEEMARRTNAIKSATKRGDEAYGQLQTVKGGLSIYDEALASLNNNAESGSVAQYLPSFKNSTRQLENARNRLGLKVISSVTFGALSEAEMKLSMDTALDLGLDEDVLFSDIKNKKMLQEFQAGRLEDAAQFLSEGTNTLADWINESKSPKYRDAVEQREIAIRQKYLNIKFNPTGRTPVINEDDSAENAPKVMVFDNEGNQING